MGNNKAKEKLLAGELVVGTHLVVSSPIVAEICGLLGFDFIIVDLEHVLFDPENFANIVRAAENSGVTPIFRPVKNDPELMLPYLDAGAMGVWIAGVSSAEEARRVVEAVKYWPLGNRGMTAERAMQYNMGRPVPELIEELNRNTLISVSIEDQEGIDNVEEICAVEGVDVVGMGPSDLSQMLGYPGQTNHPVVQETIANLIKRICDAGKVAGITAPNVEAAKKYYDLGVRYTWTNVSSLLAQAGKSYLRDVRALHK